MVSNTFSKKLFAVTIAAVAMLTLMVSPAFASEPVGAQVAITGGTLSGGDIGFTNFAPITLDGTAKTATATWTIANLVDARGTGAGWNMSLTLTQFKEYAAAAYVESGAALATSSVKVTTMPLVSAEDLTSSSAADIAVVAAETALDTATPVKLFTSDTDEGMGSFAASDMTVTLYVPANARAHTYKTDATVALVTGP